MSLFLTRAPEIWLQKRPNEKSQFRGRRGVFIFVLCRLSALSRNEMTPPIVRGGRGGETMRAILVGLFLCGASAAPLAAAEPSDEIIAHGKALVEAGDCASCHTL